MTKLQSIAEHMTTSLRAALTGGRALLSHPTLKGDASEDVWRRWFERHLPKRYAVERAVLIDSKGNESEQIDLVIFDPMFTPSLYNSEYGARMLPAESVYAVFEVKQELNAATLAAAQQKAASVRRLHRTSAAVSHVAGVTTNTKPAIPIIAGILALESTWNPSLGEPLRKLLDAAPVTERLDLGFAAQHGSFHRASTGAQGWTFFEEPHGALRFLLMFLQRVVAHGSVTAIDYDSYLTSLP